MKILIPYDGSKNTEIALGALRRRHDLAHRKHEALIIVSSVWQPASPEEFSRASAARRSLTARSGTASYAPALRGWDEDRVLFREALGRIRKMFPFWDVRVETLPGSSLVSSEILEKTERSQADLIVIGAENIFAAEAGGLGAGALRVVKEASSSVLLAREAKFGAEESLRENDYPAPDAPARALFVLDGADADTEIAQAAAGRKWTRGSRAGLVALGAQRSAVREKRLTEMLRASGLNVEKMRGQSDSPAALARMVGDWNPDCIFTGDGCCSAEESDSGGRRSFRREIEEILRLTKCTVEFVRKNQDRQKASDAAEGKIESRR